MEGTFTQISDFFMAHEGIAMVVNFLIKHADFIFGIIINLILISVFCKLADAFNAKVEKNFAKINICYIQNGANEKGNIKKPDIDMLRSLSEVLEISLEFLLTTARQRCRIDT